MTFLQTKDNIMKSHRAEWKIIVANILVALTVLGAVAVGVNYFLNSTLLGGHTKRQNLLKEVENALDETATFGID